MGKINIQGVKAGGKIIAKRLNLKPAWDTIDIPETPFENEAFSVFVGATDPDTFPDPDLTYSVSDGSLPSGLSINSSTGEISGTVDPVGSDTQSNFTLRAADGPLGPEQQGKAVDRNFSITVLDDNPPVFDLTNLSLGSVAESQNTTVTIPTITATDNNTVTQTITFSEVTSTLTIENLSIDTNTGIISGTPGTVGGTRLLEFTLRASTPTNSADKDYTITITDAQDPIWVTAIGLLATVNENEAISTISLEATDGNPVSYSVTDGALPGGLSLNSSTGDITGTPDDVTSDTTSNFEVTATDTIEADFTARSFSIKVLLVIANSLRLNDDDSAGLRRTFSGDGDSSRKMTFSTWAKRGNVGTSFTLFSAERSAAGNGFYIQFEDSDDLVIFDREFPTDVNMVKRTNALFRDPSAWYHIVFAIDTEDATPEDRQKLYINGVRITSWALSTDYPINEDLAYLNRAQVHNIGGVRDNNITTGEGYLSETYFVDGSALEPISFGAFDTNGDWQPKTYSGSFGTNGFHLDFAVAPGTGNGGGTDVSDKGSLYAEGTNIGNMTDGAGLAAAFENNLDDVNANTGAARINLASEGFVGKDWGVGVTRSINFVKLYSTDQGWLASDPAGTITLTLQGSSDNFSGDINDLGDVARSETSVVDSAEVNITDTTAYRYHRIKVTFSGTGEGTEDLVIAEVIFSETGAAELANHWTDNNLAANDQVSDSPTNNWCVINSIGETLNNWHDYQDGNLLGKQAVINNASLSWPGTIYVSSGKWHFEAVATFDVFAFIGIFALGDGVENFVGAGAGYGLRSSGDVVHDNADQSTGFSGYSTGDRVAVELDLDTNNCEWFVNGSSRGTLSISAGTYTFGVSKAGVTSSGTFVCNFGQQGFIDTPTAGFLSLNTKNLPAPTIADPSAYFQTHIYNGTGSDHAETLTGNSDLAPDFIWIKHRGNTNGHSLNDTIRGTTTSLSSDSTAAENNFNTITSFNSDGFNVGTSAQTNGISGSYVAWNWKEDTIPGFDIVSYQGTGVARTVPHSLDAVPDLMIVKNRDTVLNWYVYHSANTSAPETDFLKLNENVGTADLNIVWNDTAPTSTQFTVGTSSNTNEDQKNLIAYLWTEVEGFSRFGSYTGNASTDGPFVWCGFRPAYVLIKASSTAGDWHIYDTSRDPFNEVEKIIKAGQAVAESSGSNQLDFLSNGFKLRGTAGNTNGSPVIYTFTAFAESPFKTARAR